MGTTYERTFTVAVPVAKAWAAFTERREPGGLDVASRPRSDREP